MKVLSPKSVLSLSNAIAATILVLRSHAFDLVPGPRLSLLGAATSFSPRRHFQNHNRRSHVLEASFDEDAAAARTRNEARTDVRAFLTQRAIQSFMFLQETCRDPHTGKWIEDFLGTPNFSEFHGTGAGYTASFGWSWDAPLLEMMRRPKDVVVVSAKRRGRGHGGWSKDNPYLEERWVDFDIDIDPVSLTSRILSVREQIAREWVSDLAFLAEANGRIMDSYFSLLREEEEPDDDSPKIAYARTAVDILLNSTSTVVSSPLREGNFDLLHNLCTQASIHGVLEDLREGGDDVSFRWFWDFYVGRVAEYFDGDQKYGRADDFLEALMLKPPSAVYAGFQKAGLTDPIGMAEKIIQKRRDVLLEWQKIMLNVPTDHTEVRKDLLSKQMESWGSGGTLQ